MESKSGDKLLKIMEYVILQEWTSNTLATSRL